MSIHELTAAMKPPKQPLETGSAERWREIQEKLGTQLPGDFRDFGLTYGTGRILDQGIAIFNPFAAIFWQWMEEQISVWRDLKASEGDSEVPFEVFPGSPGLLPWGLDADGSGLFWLTEGNPDHWPIVVRGRNTEFKRFDMSLTSFLANVFTREIVPAVIWPRLRKKRTNPVFTPEAFEVKPREDPLARMSVYQHYMANGMRAGFWIEHPNWEGEDVGVFVKSVNGQAEGALKGKPPYYGEGSVIVDRFVKGELEKQDEDVCMTSKQFRIVGPPAWWTGR